MREIPFAVRGAMLVRSFAVQGSWNYETLIGAGFAFTILPALRYLYGKNGEAMEGALGRHTELFNSHPYFATVAVGAVARLEAEGAQPAVIQRFKTALRGPLGAMGDRLLWTTWRPMALLLAILLLLAGVVWWVAVGVFLAVYNALHLAVRVMGLQVGMASGLEVGRVLRDAPLQKVIETSSRLACVFVGAAVVLAAAPNLGDPTATIACVGGSILGLSLGFRTRRTLIGLLSAVAIFALLLGFFGYGA